MEVGRGALAMGFCAALALGGCASHRFETPLGYAQVTQDDHHARYKASDDVGVALRVFGNVEGGTLAYWAEDLFEKLRARDYRLRSQATVRSKNGILGTRFDFGYRPPGQDAEMFYVAVLFVTDEHRLVLQLAGDENRYAIHKERIPAMLDGIVIRGCALVDSVCKAPPPRDFTRSATTTTQQQATGGAAP